MKNRIIIVAGIASVLVTAYYFIFMWNSGRRTHGPGHIINSQRSDLNELAGNIAFAYLDQTNNPLTNVSNRLAIANSNLYQMFASSSLADRPGWAKLHLSNSNHIVDLWQNDLNCEALRTNNKIVLVIWSNGPNGKNDLRKGDDIVSEIELPIESTNVR